MTLAIYSWIQRGICTQTIMTREPLIFVFRKPSGIRKIRVPARNFPDIFIFIFIGHFKTFLKKISQRVHQLKKKLVRVYGCRMSMAVE